MVGCAVVLFLVAVFVGLLSVLPMLGLYQGCRFCRQLMWRGAVKCPHCLEWVSDAPAVR